MADDYRYSYEHGGLYLRPRPEHYQALQQKVKQTYASLPLTGCNIGYDVIDERHCIIPPAGKAFRISGKYIVETDASGAEYGYPPEESFQIRAERVKTRPLYGLLANVDDDIDKIIGFLQFKADDLEFYGDGSGNIPDWLLEEFIQEFKSYTPRYIAPHDFFGKQLRVIGGFDRENKPEVQVVVAGPPTMWSDAGLLPIALPIHGGSEEDEVYFADVQTDMHWSRDIVTGSLGDMTIELTEEPEEFKEFVVTKDESRVNWDELWVPLNYRGTPREYVKAMYPRFSELSVEEIERLRIKEMREHRAHGRPFVDDPARYIKIGSSFLMAYYSGQHKLPQLITPDYRAGGMEGRYGLVTFNPSVPDALARYVGLEVTPDQYKQSLKAFDNEGRFKGSPQNDFAMEKEEKARRSRLKKRLYATRGAFFYLEI